MAEVASLPCHAHVRAALRLAAALSSFSYLDNGWSVRMTFKQRSWSCTVHAKHASLYDTMVQMESLYTNHQVDYACISLEVSKAGRLHLQGFVVFNESLEDKPSEVLAGHWQQARSLSGARDYCARQGIHIGKKGVRAVYEFGDWVDPAWNQNLRARKCYEFSRLVREGFTSADIARYDPAGYLYVGVSQLDAICAVNFDVPKVVNEPYYYIGRKQYFLNLEDDVREGLYTCTYTTPHGEATGEASEEE